MERSIYRKLQSGFIGGLLLILPSLSYADDAGAALPTDASPAPAAEETATLTLTNGEVSEVTIVSIEEGKQAVVRLQNGEEKVIKWSWIAKLEKHADGPPVGLLGGATAPALTPTIPEESAASNIDHEHAVPGSNPQYNERTTMDLRLEREDTGLGGPIVMISVGGAMAIIGGYALLFSAADRSHCDKYGYGISFAVCDVDNYTVPMIIEGVILASGLTLGIIGGVGLGRNIGIRKSLGNEIEHRQNYGTNSAFTLGLAPIVAGRDGHGLGLVGTF